MAERTRGSGGFTDGPLRALPGPGGAWPITTGADTFGPWSVLVADTGPADAYLLGVYVENPAAGAVAGVYVRFTAGDLDAPEPLAGFRPGRIAAGATIYVPTGYPLRVRAGSRLAAAGSSTSGATLNLGVAFTLFGANL